MAELKRQFLDYAGLSQFWSIVNHKIDEKINLLDSVKTGNGKLVSVKVELTNGKVTDVTVDDNAIEGAVNDQIDAKINELDYNLTKTVKGNKVKITLVQENGKITQFDVDDTDIQDVFDTNISEINFNLEENPTSGSLSLVSGTLVQEKGKITKFEIDDSKLEPIQTFVNKLKNTFELTTATGSDTTIAKVVAKPNTFEVNAFTADSVTSTGKTTTNSLEVTTETKTKTLNVTTNAEIDGNISSGSLNTGNTEISGTLSVTGETSISSDLDVTGDITSSTLNTGEANVSALNVTENISVDGNVSIDGTLTSGGKATVNSLEVTTTSALKGNVTVGTSAANANVTVNGNVTSTGKTTTNTLETTGNTTIGGSLVGNSSATFDGDVTGKDFIIPETTGTGAHSQISLKAVDGRVHNIENLITSDNDNTINKLNEVIEFFDGVKTTETGVALLSEVCTHQKNIENIYTAEVVDNGTHSHTYDKANGVTSSFISLSILEFNLMVSFS